MYLETSRLSAVRVRDGELEDLTQATGKGLGLRVFAAGGLGFSYTSEFDAAGVDAFVSRAIALAKLSAKDSKNELPKPHPGAPPSKDLDSFDAAVAELSTEWKIEAAKAAESAARSVDPRVVRFEGTSSSDYVEEVFIVSSEGIEGRHRGTYVHIGCQPIAAEGTQLQVGSWSDTKRFLRDLAPAEEIGRRAGLRAVQMLGARRVKTQRVPVVFEPSVAAAFIGNLARAVNGDLVTKRASFLSDHLGQTIAPSTVTVVDDGLLRRGLASSPFDGEGVSRQTTSVVERGVLKAFLFDTYTARKARARSTASATRGYRSLPSVGSSNFFLVPGHQTPEQIIGGVKEGLYVTGMLGHGANTITGDFSQGATGRWIENGELTHAVQESTVAGNLLEMLSAIDAVGNDLEFRSTLASPTLRFSELTVSGD